MWVKLDVEWMTNPKVLAVEPTDRLLWLASISWSMQHLTDGYVPEHVLPALAVLAGAPIADPAAQRLAEAGLWDATDGGWRVHDYDEHQQSAEQVENGRKAAADRQARARARKAEQRAEAAASALPTPITPAELADTIHAYQAEHPEDRPDDWNPEPPTSRRDSRVSHTARRRRDETRKDQEIDAHLVNKCKPEDDPAPPAPPAGSAEERNKPTEYFAELVEGWQQFAALYPKRNGKRVGMTRAEAAWKRLRPAERRAALVGLANYAAARPDGATPSACDPDRWLKGRQWVDWQEPETPAVAVRPAPTRLTAREALARRSAAS